MKRQPIGIKATRNGFAVVLATPTSVVPGRQYAVLTLGREFTGRMAKDRARRAAGTDNVIPEGEPASVTARRFG